MTTMTIEVKGTHRRVKVQMSLNDVRASIKSIVTFLTTLEDPAKIEGTEGLLTKLLWLHMRISRDARKEVAVRPTFMDWEVKQIVTGLQLMGDDQADLILRLSVINEALSTGKHPRSELVRVMNRRNGKTAI